jgi:hypothetical protein
MRTEIPLCIAVVCWLPGCAPLGSAAGPEAHCRAAGASAQLGQYVDDKVLMEARAGATALRSRVLPYGAPPPADGVDPMRLNVEVVTEADGRQRIRRLRCG